MKKLGFLTVLLVLTACGQTPTGPKLPEVDQTQGFSGDLPTGSKVVSEEEFRSKLNEPGAEYYTPEKDKKNAEAAAAKEAADQKTIEDFLNNNDLPELKALLANVPDPKDPSVKPLADGNYELITSDNAEQTLKVITLGQRFKKSELARSIENFPKKDNQLGIYELIYSNLSEVERKEYQLPTLEEMRGSDLRTINAVNSRFQQIYPGLIAGLLDPTKPVGWTDDPTKEQGYLDGSDRTNSAASCSAFKDTGIYKNFEWPLKYYATSVKNQGMRGSCVAFAIVAATEMQYAKANNKWINLSEQAFYNRIANVWQPRTYGDGADTTFIYNTSAAQGHQFALENQWGYNASWSRSNILNASDELIGYNNSCTGYTDSYCSDTAHQSQVLCVKLFGNNFCINLPKPVTPAAPAVVPQGQLELWNHENKDLSIAYMILTLAFKNTVVASLGVMPSWDDANANGFALSQSYNDGKKSRGGHAVQITGFITNSKLREKLPNAPEGEGGGYFIVKNSWGACWKDGGYIYIPFDYMKAYGYSAIRVSVK
ncbi:C1 family peptidase [Deinococcus misasensis]|uniref:C1 family peptidase n=1 Tax=Deinococcus misasensis TaxID=392413 RepID=UPI00054E1C96|nr:C1 family peptidase [Deinococcus misasensis]